MEPISNILPETTTSTGSSASRSRTDEAPERACLHCQTAITAEFCEFPPVLARKYGRSGEWFYPPCSDECERTAEHEEWERDRRDHLLQSLLRRSGVSKRLQRATFENYDTTVFAVGGNRTTLVTEVGSRFRSGLSPAPSALGLLFVPAATAI